MSKRFTQRGVIAWVVLLIAVIAALLAARYFTGGGPTGASAVAQAQAPKPASQPAPAAASQEQPPAAPEDPFAKEQIPLPGCFENLIAFDRSASLENFRAGLSLAVNHQDAQLATYFQERLTELVGNDAKKALTVLDWAEGSSQPELGVYMEALKNAEAVHRPEVAERLLRMGENAKSGMPNRQAALATLETQRHMDAAQIKRMKAIALDERVDELAWMATRTLGRVMKEDFERTGNYRAYWDQLLEVGQKSEDTAVRLLALEMPSYSNPILDSGSIDKLSKIMRSDSERDVREMAAFRLAVTEEPKKALEAYRTAFETEQDLCVRWAIFRFAVRAAGVEALPLLQQFAARDPRLAQDYRDFKQLYADGTTDFSRIWLGKKENIQCNGE